MQTATKALQRTTTPGLLLCLPQDSPLTGEPLSLLSFTDGLCSTQQSRASRADASTPHQQQQNLRTEGSPAQPAHKQRKEHGPGAARTASALALGDTAVGVSCDPDAPGGTFSLYVPGEEPGQPIPFGAPLLLKEGDK